MTKTWTLIEFVLSLHMCESLLVAKLHYSSEMHHHVIAAVKCGVLQEYTR